MNLLLSTIAGSPWLPPAASAQAAGVDWVFGLIFFICLFFFLLVLALVVVFVWKYRARSWTVPEASATHNTPLELLWSGIPFLLVLGIFGSSTAAWLKLTEPPQGELLQEVQVTARKWSWWFDHPGGKGSSDLHVVKGKSVRLTMSAQDVLHSLYVPAFRVKQDVLPGRFTKIWFTPIEEGEFTIYCAEFCGTNHSKMISKVVVHPDQASYDQWKSGQDTSAMPLADLGKQIYQTRGCLACHSLDGAKGLGPSFKGLWGKMEALSDGSSAKVDEDYVRESLLNPTAKVVAGFPPSMPPTPLQEREIKGVIELLKSLP